MSLQSTDSLKKLPSLRENSFCESDQPAAQGPKPSRTREIKSDRYTQNYFFDKVATMAHLDADAHGRVIAKGPRGNRRRRA